MAEIIRINRAIHARHEYEVSCSWSPMYHHGFRAYYLMIGEVDTETLPYPLREAETVYDIWRLFTRRIAAILRAADA